MNKLCFDNYGLLRINEGTYDYEFTAYVCSQGDLVTEQKTEEEWRHLEATYKTHS